MQHGLYKRGSARPAAPPPPKLPLTAPGKRPGGGAACRTEESSSVATARVRMNLGSRPAGCHQGNRNGTGLVRPCIWKTSISPWDLRRTAEKRTIASHLVCQDSAPLKACAAGRHNAQPPNAVSEERRDPLHRRRALALRVAESFQIATLCHLETRTTSRLSGHHHTQVTAVSCQKASNGTSSGPTAA